MFEVRGVTAFEDNYIWLAGRPGSDRVLVVDPGDADPVLEFLDARGLRAEAILITHRHGDHTGGIDGLVSRFGVEVYFPAHERVRGGTRPVCDGECLRFPNGIELQVMETPGHTLGHVCYLGNGAIFCGDTLFTAGCGRLFEGTPAQMHASLERIRALPDDTLVYCAHEYTLDNLRFAQIAEPANAATTERLEETRERRERGMPTVPSRLSIEKATNPFLRCHLPELKRAAEAWAGRELTDGAAVFAAVRTWKDELD